MLHTNILPLGDGEMLQLMRTRSKVSSLQSEFVGHKEEIPQIDCECRNKQTFIYIMLSVTCEGGGGIDYTML